MIEYMCVYCGESMESPSSKADAIETCPNCGRNVRVPGMTPRMPGENLLWAALRAIPGLGWWIAIACVIGWLASYRRPPSDWTQANYGCLMVAVGIIGWKTLRCLPWPKRHGVMAGVTAAVIALTAFAAGCFDRWEEDKTIPGGVIGTEKTICTTYRRFGKVPVYRHVRLRSKDLKLWFTHGWSAEGPLSPSGKRHGKWTLLFWTPPWRGYDQWYWYGEEVTEGQFRLQDK